jgi:sterol O-acyltransferase
LVLKQLVIMASLHKSKGGQFLHGGTDITQVDELLRDYDKRRPHLKFDNEYTPSPTPGGSPELAAVSEKLVSPVSPDVVSPGVVPLAHLPKKTQKEYRRIKFRNLSSEQQFSILDIHASKRSTFTGFFTLFWVTLGVMFIRRLTVNYLERQELMGMNVTRIFLKDLHKVALTDLWMYCMTYLGFGVQLAIKNGYITWERCGWYLQHLYQTAFLFFFAWFSNYMDFPWIGSVFLLLHSFVLLMKQHSFAFYNGYFWGISRELKESQGKLKRLEDSSSKDIEKETKLLASINFCKEELESQSNNGIRFPDNITFFNHFQYTMFPTLVYQIEYPRTDKIRWNYVFEKAAGVFGVIFMLILVAETYLYPISMQAIALRNTSFEERLVKYPLILLDTVPPFVLITLLVFYLIWDSILNGIAELTRFGDRNFYGEWWNCSSWDQFAKEWNVPVHRFLLRHVYHSSMSSLKLNKFQATLLTFLLSSVIHEFVMFSIFKKLRGYLLFLQMFQLPLITLSTYFKGHWIIGNAFFWFGMLTGPSIMCSLYLTF